MTVASISRPSKPLFPVNASRKYPLPCKVHNPQKSNAIAADGRDLMLLAWRHMSSSWERAAATSLHNQFEGSGIHLPDLLRFVDQPFNIKNIFVTGVHLIQLLVPHLYACNARVRSAAQHVTLFHRINRAAISTIKHDGRRCRSDEDPSSRLCSGTARRTTSERPPSVFGVPTALREPHTRIVLELNSLAFWWRVSRSIG